MSVKTIPNLLSDTSSAINDNTSRDISPADVRNVLSDIIDSSINRVTDKPLLNLREYSTARPYEVGETAVYLLTIYQCIAPTSGAFAPANWVEISGVPTSLSGITAAGASQATATALTKRYNRIDTVAVGTGVVNSAAETVGFTRTVQNKGLNDLLYYPFLGSNFLGLAVNAPVTISPDNQATVFCFNNGILTLI